jgi:hypothetical protein
MARVLPISRFANDVMAFARKPGAALPPVG